MTFVPDGSKPHQKIIDTTVGSGAETEVLSGVPLQKVRHEASHEHVTGKAEYIDDRTFYKNEVYVEVFYSTETCGEILNLDLSEALKVDGVCGIYTHKDLAHNRWGTIFQDQPFLAEDQVVYVGEPIAIIAAQSLKAARIAKSKIKIDIRKTKSILSIQESIEKKAFVGPLRTIERGDVGSILDTSTLKNNKSLSNLNTLQGELQIAGQDHFYLESQACIAYPKEAGQIEIHASSQHPTEVQHLVAEALGLKHNQIVCVVKRMGGGFGGKESQAAPFSVFASLVAHKLGVPARLVLTKDDDMIITGKRNPFLCKYKVGFANDGKILALDAQLYSDSGAYADLSTAIMERAMLHIDNAYFIPNFKVTGQVCKTNTHPSTAFRGFGGPKGIATIENIIEEISIFLKKDALDIRELNVYKKDNTTHYNQVIEDNILPELFKKLRDSCQYDLRRKQISEFNLQSKTYIKGLSLTPVKFGISFTTRFLNQGSALVNIHLDGTVQVSTGATEMGQGVNTKIAQVVAGELSIPVSDVRVMPTSTEKVANTSATAASSGSDINAQAALTATVKIKERLKKVAEIVLTRSESLMGRKVAGAGTAEEIDISNVSGNDIVFENSSIYLKSNKNRKISFSQLIEEAYLNRISLTDNGFFKYSGIFFNKETGKGNPFYYFTNGVAATEVSIDKYTGELKILRADLLMDLGRLINLGIDQGQVIGAYVQGLGWLTTEKLFYKDGALLSHSPSTYKIPSIHDIPRELNCNFIENSSNQKNVKGSKAVGEPPLMLAISAWAAIKNALGKPSNLPIPATQEEIFWQMRNL